MVVWPSLPGLPQAAVGVAPPPPSMAGSGAPVGRVGEVTGRGGILTASGAAGMASPGISGIEGSCGVTGSLKARRSKQRPADMENKDESKVR